MFATRPMQSPAVNPDASPRSVAAAHVLTGGWPYGRWVLLVLAPLLAALALALHAQRNTVAAQALALETAQLQARTALVIKNASQSADIQGTPQGFKGEFPAYALRLERLQDFLARLAQLGTATPPTSYRQTALGDSGLLAHQVNLATTTSYSAWRDFVDDVLWADPALSLTSLSLNRSDANAAQVRVQAVFSFYMQVPERGSQASPTVPRAPSAPTAQPEPQIQQTGTAP